MQPGDGGLQGEPAVTLRGVRRVADAVTQEPLVPARPVDLVEGQGHPVGVHASGAAREPEAYDGAQPTHLGVRGVQRDEGVGDRQGLGAGVGQGVLRGEARAVGDGEHAGHALEHDRQPCAALGLVGHPELLLRLGQRPLGPGEPGGRGGVLEAEVGGDLGDVEPADDP